MRASVISLNKIGLTICSRTNFISTSKFMILKY